MSRPAPAEVLVALDGTVAGALSRLAADETDVGVLDEERIRQGADEVQLLVPHGDGGFATGAAATP